MSNSQMPESPYDHLPALSITAVLMLLTLASMALWPDRMGWMSTIMFILFYFITLFGEAVLLCIMVYGRIPRHDE